MRTENKTKPVAITLADHAEAWQTERGREVPPRNTTAWKTMYEEWVKFAFQDFGGKT